MSTGPAKENKKYIFSSLKWLVFHCTLLFWDLIVWMTLVEFRLSWSGPLVLKFLFVIWLFNLVTFSVSDEGYSYTWDGPYIWYLHFLIPAQIKTSSFIFSFLPIISDLDKKHMFSFWMCSLTICNKQIYYIDRCELWGFISEINSSISHYQFFSSRNYFYATIKCGGYIPCCATVNTQTIVNWRKSANCYWRLCHITKMTSLTSYEYFQFET